MKKAFTLAEVLLVLAIIGVIAALTVPNLVTSNMDKKYVALAKKAQTTLQQAIDTKMGDAAVGTNRMNMQLIAWLSTAQNDAFGNITAPAVLRVSNSDANPPTRVLTTDGILYENTSALNACTNANVCYIRVDLDGAAGITGNTVGTAIAGAGNGATDVRSRDVIEFECRRNFIAPSERANAAAERAREYLGFEENP